jgi:hypothetical protein
VLKTYSPLSSAVSCEFPERLAAVTSEHDITVCETYLRGGVPHVVLSHLFWDFRVHFAVRWMIREINAPPVALLEVVDWNYAHQLPQVFVYVTGNMSLSLVEPAQFNRMIEKVFRSIVTAQHLGRLAMSQKLISDGICTKSSSSRYNTALSSAAVHSSLGLEAAMIRSCEI